MPSPEDPGGPAPPNLPSQGGEAVAVDGRYMGWETGSYALNDLLEADSETGRPTHTEVYFETRNDHHDQFGIDRYVICPREMVTDEPNPAGARFVLAHQSGRRAAGEIVFDDLPDSVLMSTTVTENGIFSLHDSDGSETFLTGERVIGKVTAVDTDDYLDDFDLQELRASTVRSDFWSGESDQPEPETPAGPGFSAIGAERGYVDPYGEIHREPVWYQPRPERIDWNGDPGVLRQSNWGESPNSSCGLTAILNGWVCRGAMLSEEAAGVQDTLVHDDRYRDNAAFWTGTPANPRFREFTSRSDAAAFAAWEIVGEPMPFDTENVSAADAPSRLNELLDEGYILAVGSGRHWRTLLRPRNLAAGLTIAIDPQEATIDTIGSAQVAGLHNEDRLVIKM